MLFVQTVLFVECLLSDRQTRWDSEAYILSDFTEEETEVNLLLRLIELNWSSSWLLVSLNIWQKLLAVH